MQILDDLINTSLLINKSMFFFFIFVFEKVKPM